MKKAALNLIKTILKLTVIIAVNIICLELGASMFEAIVVSVMAGLSTTILLKID